MRSRRVAVAKTRRKTAQKRAALLSVVGVLAGCYAYSELSQTHWRSGLGAALLAFGCVLCLLAFVVKGRCGVLNAHGRTYCRNPIYGLVFGCYIHTFERPRSLLGLGIRRQAPPPPRAYRRAQQSTRYAVAGSTPIPVLTSDERERRRSTILFYIAIASLTTGSLSTFTDLFGFIKEIT
jgi:hypothetical protein